MVSHGNNPLRDVVEPPLLEVFKMQLDRVLGNLIQAPLPIKGWKRRSFKVLSNLGMIPTCLLPPLGEGGEFCSSCCQ